MRADSTICFLCPCKIWCWLEINLLKNSSFKIYPRITHDSPYCVGICYTPLRHSERRESATLVAFQSISSNSHNVILIFLSFRLLNKVITPLCKAFTLPDSFVVSYKKPKLHHYLVTASRTLIIPLYLTYIQTTVSCLHKWR